MCVNLKLYKVLMQLIKKKNANPPKNIEFSPLFITSSKKNAQFYHPGKSSLVPFPCGVSDWESSSKIKLPFVTSHRLDSLDYL